MCTGDNDPIKAGNGLQWPPADTKCTSNCLMIQDNGDPIDAVLMTIMHRWELNASSVSQMRLSKELMPKM